MKSFTYNVTHCTLQESLSFTELNEIRTAPTVLIQIFSGESKERIEAVLEEVATIFASAVVIGATTDGEIQGALVTTGNTIVTISLFYKTTIESFYTPLEDSFEAGVVMAESLVEESSKLLLSFADGLLTNGEEYLNGIYSVAPELIVAGGLAGDNGLFKSSYVIYGSTLYEKGAVGVVLNSDHLRVEPFYNFGWEKIGLEHTVTKAEKNRVYTIDDLSVVDFYSKYLGEIADELPATAVEFPLIKVEDDIDIARAALKRHKDGSVSFAGNIATGEKVYLGIGNIDKILLKDMESELLGVAVESFFIYSCMARRRFVLELIAKELKPFAALAPTSGFFTYGEFYTAHKPKLLNETLTAVSLSEDYTKCINIATKKEPFKKQRTAQYKTYKAMSHLITQTVKEYNSINAQLQKKIYQEKLQSLESRSKYQLLIDTMSEGLIICDDTYSIIDMNSAMTHLLGYTREELEGRTILCFTDTESSFKVASCMQTHNNGARMEVVLKRKDGSSIYVLIGQKEIFINRKRAHMAVIVDITELKEKDRQLLMQTKLAQMGEMINMIAHQWRQPLNAISTAAISLSMKNELGMLESAEINKSSEFIQQMAQKMSQTINDFMNLSKNESKREPIVVAELFEELMSLIHAQFAAHNIMIEIRGSKELVINVKKQELMHILINLLVNARDALDEHEVEEKKIIIQTYAKERSCFIDVIDNGGGIPEDILGRVFELYFTTKEQGKGTGLGLYMSKKMANEFLNGDLYVKNVANGAQFTIELREALE